jgi:predicted dehydrogenase
MGVSTFLEKPIACTSSQARQLGASANNLLAVSDQRIHRADIQLARRLIRSGYLGEILTIHYYDAIKAAPRFRTSWRNNPQLAGGGILFDLGYHTINTIQWLIDLNPAHLDIITVELSRKTYNVEEQAVVAARYQGTEIRLNVSFTENSPGECLKVAGTHRTLKITRSRTSGLTSSVSFSHPSGPSKLSYKLDPSYDTLVLSNFLSYSISNQSVSRHIETVEILEQLYNAANSPQ